MNLVTSIDLIEHPNKAGKYQIIIGMYYSEPFVLDFDNKLAATTRFTELFEAWHDSEAVSAEDLNKIKEAVDRLAEKVDTLNQALDIKEELNKALREENEELKNKLKVMKNDR